MDYCDWFESLMGLPIVVSSGRVQNPENEVVARLYDIISFLDSVGAKDAQGDLIVEKARAAYLANIKSRASRHHQLCTELKSQIDTLKISNPSDVTLPDLARDYHHNAYYCAFYCARHLLVCNGRLDTNLHDKIPEHLRKYVIFDQTVANTVDKIVTGMRTMQENRNKADYNMASRVVALLTDQTSLNQTEQMLMNITSDCGVR